MPPFPNLTVSVSGLEALCSSTSGGLNNLIKSKVQSLTSQVNIACASQVVKTQQAVYTFVAKTDISKLADLSQINSLVAKAKNEIIQTMATGSLGEINSIAQCFNTNIFSILPFDIFSMRLALPNHNPMLTKFLDTIFDNVIGIILDIEKNIMNMIRGFQHLLPNLSGLSNLLGLIGCITGKCKNFPGFDPSSISQIYNTFNKNGLNLDGTMNLSIIPNIQSLPNFKTITNHLHSINTAGADLEDTIKSSLSANKIFPFLPQLPRIAAGVSGTAL